MSWPIVTYVLTAAVRDKLVISLMLLLVLGTSLSVFLGSAAISEQDQFAVVFAGGGLRFTGVLGLVLFVVFMMRRSFETKDVEFLLSRPVGRIEFLFSYAAAFSVLAIAMGIAQGLCIYILGSHLFGAGHMLWITSIIVENIIMVNVALFFSMFLTSAATAAMATFAFYILARMMGQILGILDSGVAGADLPILKMAVQMISSLTPRLDLMGQTSWLVYGIGEGVNFGYMFIQGGIFTILVLLACLLDLVRREF
ncbi:MAG: hypothetical protein KAJ86_04135 [Alphaproteobacteria bacterium]|nr:hypothetical protein [Alphaproteobacteria bacterium]